MTQYFNLIRCDHLFDRSIYDTLRTDICGIDRAKYIVTCLAIIVLFIGCIYLRRKYEKCHKTLLTFHNWRAAVSLLLLAINSLELARSLLPGRSMLQMKSLFESGTELNALIVIGTGAVWNAVAAISLTLMLMCYHRVVERKKMAAFLYVSIAMELLVFVIRIDELAEVVYFVDLWELESFLDGISIICLLTLMTLDGYTIYKERYRPDYLEDYDNIGYKHTLATFYSKSCFWWLTPLLRFGYHVPLELENLGHMRLEDSARAHYDRFLLIYKTVRNSNAPPSLWYCYAKSSWRMFALGGIFKLAGDLFALIGPLAIQQIVQYIEMLYATTAGKAAAAAAQSLGHEFMPPVAAKGVGAPNQIDPNAAIDVDEVLGIGIGDVRIYYASWSDLLTNGWSIAWIVLLAALTQAALSQASTHVLNMTGIRIKTSLQGLIYRKSLLLNASSSSSSSGVSHNASVDSAADDDVVSNGIAAKLTAQKAGQTTTTATAEQTTDSGAAYDIGAITNHMTEDTLNIMQFFWIVHYAWAIPFKIAVVIYLLYLQLGISAVIGAIVCITIMTPLQFLIGNAMSKNAEVIAKYTDERLKKIHDTLIGIKIIKLNAWDNVFLKKIQAARNMELKYLNKDAFYWTLMTILTHISTVLITFVTLAVYVWLPRDAHYDFNASHLFSALALFQQLTVPLLIFPITVPIIIAARTSTRRLERFLHAREIQKQFEGIRNMARILSKSDASLDMYETQEKSNMTMRTAQAENKLNQQRMALRIQIPEQPAPLATSEPITPLLQSSVEPAEDKTPAAVCHELRHRNMVQQRRDLLRNTPYVAIRPPKMGAGTVVVEKPVEFSALRARNTDSWRRDSLLLKMPEDIAVSINDGLFTWQPQSHLPYVQLHIPEMAIPKGKLTVIVGKNGSGKSSLLSALLMEMPLLAGNMFWHKTSTISYVPQQPWLLNASIRENILFGESFRPKRFDFVLDACALKPDIELMPHGDFSIIGERGLNLSGGQRQRIAIARAIYSSANVVIMDDPLSSLDNEVGRHVFEQCVRQMLLKSKRTIILVTQQIQLIKEADYLIVMKDGRLQACGSYKDIELKQPQIIAKWNSIIAKANAKEQQQPFVCPLERTARERWKLFKNVSKLGLQRSISVTSETSNGVELDALDGCVSMSINGMSGEAPIAVLDAVDDDDDDELLASLPGSTANLQHGSSFKLQRKRSSVYGSRHLIYDVPLPIDECQTDDVIMRPRRRATLQLRTGSARACNSWHRLSGISTATATSTSSASSGDLLRRSVLTTSCSSHASSSADAADGLMLSVEHAADTAAVGIRAQSWQLPQPQPQHQTLTRNASSPPVIDADVIAEQQQRQQQQQLEQQALQSRGSSFQQFLRRMSMRRSNKPKHHHRPLSATNSILSISEESSASALLPTIELSSVAATPDALLPAGMGDATTNWLANSMAAAAAAATADELQELELHRPVKHVNIDYKALTTNGCSNKNAENGSSHNNNNDATDAADVTQAGATATTTTTLTLATTDMATPRSSTLPIELVDAERKYGKISNHIYVLYIRASGIAKFILFFITALIWQCLRVYTDVWLQHWSDHADALSDADGNGSKHSSSIDSDGNSNNSNNNNERHEVTYYFRMYATISCVCIIMAMISTPAGQWAGCNARRNLHDKLLQTILHKSLHFFQVTPLGRIVNRFSNDMAIIDKKIAATSQRLLQFTMLCLCAILINVIVTPWFLVLTIPICAAYYMIQKFYRCSARELQRISNSTDSPVISHLSETIQGVTTIRAYNQEARFTEILFQRLEANTIAFTILNTSNRWLGISLDYLGGCIVFVAIVTALVTASVSCSSYVASKLAATYAINKNMPTANLVKTSDKMTPTPSLVGLAINYTLLVPIYLNWVVKLLADMEMYAGSVERIAYYAEQQPQRQQEQQYVEDEFDVEEQEQEQGQKEQQEPERTTDDLLKISNKVDRSSLSLLSSSAVDKVNSSTTSAAVDVDGDQEQEQQEQQKQQQQEPRQVADAGNADKLNAGIAAGSGNHLDLQHTATVVDKLQASTVGLSVIKDKQIPTAAAAAVTVGKVALPNEAARQRGHCQRQRHCLPKVKIYQSVPISWPQRGDISFENVSLRYEGQRQNVIKDLTLKIPAGQRIGICGRTGSGKSSLALSLFGVLETTSGCIRIDDVDIEQIQPDELRTRLSIIPQDVHLFNATIRENLDPHSYYSDLQLWNCLELAQLKEFVMLQLPQGLDTEIIDGGINLSAGHRQLLCLARAILRGSVCLVLDEATSTLDSSTESALLLAADKAFKGRTIITIAHRLTTILDYERIIVLEQGSIVEDGDPRQLQQQSNSTFYNLLHTCAGDESVSALGVAATGNKL